MDVLATKRLFKLDAISTHAHLNKGRPNIEPPPADQTQHPRTAPERLRESLQAPPESSSPKFTQALSDSPGASQAPSRITSDRTTATTTVDL